MTQRAKPPFRADHVGSFLRFRKQEIGKAELRAVEDRAIGEIVRMQEDAGLQGITDGEFRRTYFHVDFLEQFDGIETHTGFTSQFHTKKGDVGFAPPVLKVTGKVKHARPIQLEDFKFLKSVTKKTPKVTVSDEHGMQDQ